jgi:pilus assembly protein Flp/PilA
MYIYPAKALAEFKASTCRFIASWMRKVCGNESGATAVEYGLIIAGIALTIVAIVFSLGNNVLSSYQYVVDRINTVLPI